MRGCRGIVVSKDGALANKNEGSTLVEGLFVPGRDEDSLVPFGQDRTQVFQAILFGKAFQKGKWRARIEKCSLYAKVEIQGIVESILGVDKEIVLSLVKLQVLNQTLAFFGHSDGNHDEFDTVRLELIHFSTPLDEELLTQGSPEAPHKDDHRKLVVADQFVHGNRFARYAKDVCRSQSLTSI
jgi:hypothetical protein